MTDIVPSVSALRSKVDQVLGLKAGVQFRLDQTLKDIKRLENEDVLLGLVSELFRRLIDQEVTIGVQAVEKLLTEGLQTVFDDQDLLVKSIVDVQRGKVSVDLVTVQKNPNGDEIEGLSNDAFGGGAPIALEIL